MKFRMQVPPVSWGRPSPACSCRRWRRNSRLGRWCWPAPGSPPSPSHTSPPGTGQLLKTTLFCRQCCGSALVSMRIRIQFRIRISMMESFKNFTDENKKCNLFIPRPPWKTSMLHGTVLQNTKFFNFSIFICHSPEFGSSQPKLMRIHKSQACCLIQSGSRSRSGSRH